MPGCTNSPGLSLGEGRSCLLRNALLRSKHRKRQRKAVPCAVNACEPGPHPPCAGDERPELGTSAVHRQGAPRAVWQHTGATGEGRRGGRQGRAVENKWGKETIQMLSIGAEVCRTAGNDLLAFTTYRETEGREPGQTVLNPAEGFHGPALPLPGNTHRSTTAAPFPTSLKLEPETGAQEMGQGPGCPLPAPRCALLSSQASGANVLLSLPPGCLLPPTHLAPDPRLATVTMASAVQAPGCEGSRPPWVSGNSTGACVLPVDLKGTP